MKILKIILCVFTLASVSFAKEVKLGVSLSPAGSFEAKSNNLSGKVNYKKSSDKIWASRLKVSIKSFDTGMSLRNEHFAKHLNAKEYPNAIISKFRGTKGRATGTLKLAGAKKKILIVYKVIGSEVLARFKVDTKELGLKKVKYLGVGVKDVVEVTVKMPVNLR